MTAKKKENLSILLNEEWVYNRIDKLNNDIERHKSTIKDIRKAIKNYERILKDIKQLNLEFEGDENDS